jgi:hypothetical protein
MSTPPPDSPRANDDRAGSTTAPPSRHPALERIDEALRDLRYGSVLAIVQDGVVVQIERTEKTRLPLEKR